MRQTVYYDFRIAYPAGSLVGEFIEANRGWDEVIAPIVREIVATARPVIVEVGSNVGASLVHILRAAPDARVICFEPVPHFAALLRANVEVNRWTNVEVREVAVARRAEVRDLSANETTASLVAKRYGGHRFIRGMTVETAPLDAVLTDLDRLDLLKVDTDGFDLDVLLGAETLVRALQPAIFVEYHPGLLERAGHAAEDLLVYLNRLGYESLLVLSNHGEALAVETSVEAVLRHADEQPYVDLFTIPGGVSAQRTLQDLCASLGARYSTRESAPAGSSSSRSSAVS